MVSLTIAQLAILQCHTLYKVDYSMYAILKPQDVIQYAAAVCNCGV